MRKIVKLTESDLNRLVKKVIKEQEVSEFYFKTSDDDNEPYKSPNRKERMMVKSFKKEIMDNLVSGGTDWSVNNENPHLKDLIDGIRRVCDKFESLN